MYWSNELKLFYCQQINKIVHPVLCSFDGDFSVEVIFQFIVTTVKMYPLLLNIK